MSACTCIVVPDELRRVERDTCPVHGIPMNDATRGPEERIQCSECLAFYGGHYASDEGRALCPSCATKAIAWLRETPRLEARRMPGGFVAFREWDGRFWTTWTVVADPHHRPTDSEVARAAPSGTERETGPVRFRQGDHRSGEDRRRGRLDDAYYAWREGSPRPRTNTERRAARGGDGEHPRGYICENCDAIVNLRYIPCPCCGESLAHTEGGSDE